ncbi:MAG: hypothetical protein QXM54_01645 [Desulfurococcaceae archaeon]
MLNTPILFLGLFTTAIYIILTFLRIRLSTLFMDFAVFLSSILVAIAVTFNPVWNSLNIALSIFLYINALWLYGIENRVVPRKRTVINPSLPRVFVGLILYLVATWIIFSQLDVRLGIIAILLSIILGTHRMVRIEKTM